jgi:hypothetical protein
MLLVQTKDRGPALAVGVIDHGPGHELALVVMLKETGEFVRVPISELRGQADTIEAAMPAKLSSGDMDRG